MVFGARYAPAVFLGAALANATVNTHLYGLLIIGLGNMIEALIAFYLISFFLQRNFLKGYTEFYSLLFGAVIASFVSATIGSVYLYVDGIVPVSDFTYSWYTWWSGDLVGIMIIVPFVMQMLSPVGEKISLKKIFFAILLTLIFFALTYMVFVQSYNLSFSWALNPIFILAGFTLGHFLSRAILIILSMFIVVLTAKGYSPYDYGNLNLNLIYAQTLLISYSFSILFVKPFDTGFKVSWKFISGILIAWATLFLIIFLTFKYERNFTREDLRVSVESATESMEKTTTQVELLLNSSSAMVGLKPDFSGEEWKIFVESLKLRTRHDEINGIGVVYPVMKDNVQVFFNDMKKRGSRIKTIHQIDGNYALQFRDEFIIGFAEPHVNDFALGWDMGSEMERRNAANKSREIKGPFSTKPIKLIKTEENGFVIFNPIFKNVDDFIGWIYIPLNTNIFFNRALKEFSHVLRVKIYHDNEMIFNLDRYPKDVYKNQSYLLRKTLTIFGQEHSFEFYPTAQFFTRHSGYSAILALLMNLFMLFITGFLLEQVVFSQRAEGMVNERTRELEESKIQLINSSKMASLGEMASGMAHEINNPLTIIMGKIKIITLMMEESKIEHPAILKEMSRMRVTTERIGKIVKGLRSFSRVSDFDPYEKVAAATIVQETFDLCREKFKAKGIMIQLGTIPDVYLNCRPSQISQVFLNLLSNAYDALQDETLKSPKWIHMDFVLRTDNLIEISVTDNGRGISQDIVEKIMDPFFTTKEAGKGTGLGLSIAKGIIEDHGGRIWLDTKSKNTRFVIDLPYQRTV